MRRKDLNYELARRLFEQLKQIGPYFLGDFYPLTPYSLANNIWMAWQYHRPELGEGFVEAFRRGDCPDESIRLQLRGLDPEARYTLTDVDVNQPWQASGQELLAQGLAVKSPSRPTAILITYKTGTRP
jgi:alpha-galactosidase